MSNSYKVSHEVQKMKKIPNPEASISFQFASSISVETHPFYGL
jgi:hypothetical protein